jgi:hypothetical protein
MAMLLLPEVFERTWGDAAQPFWPKAIARVRESYPNFCVMAEVYWDLEWTLQQQGFDYTYDKRLYDRLRDRHARSVREHFLADLQYQNKLARFLENHDEPRAATVFCADCHKAAATVTFLSPGLRFFHQGQFEGRRKRISPHLVRAPAEPLDQPLGQFYDRLLTILRHDAVRTGQWQLLDCRPAWDGNTSSDSFIVFWWELNESRFVVAVNYSGNQGQCYVKLPFPALANARWQLRDLLGDAVYERDGSDLVEHGLYLDEPAWKAMVFSLTKN